MKKWFIIALAGVGAVALLMWWKNRRPPVVVNGVLSQSARNAGNNAMLQTYQDTIPPIAQLARVPWANTNLRSVDPVIPAPIYPAVISQNA